MKADLFEGQITSAEDALRFVYAGHALFTLVSRRTQKRFTYKVSQSRSNREANTRFVRVLNGPDNEVSYMYLGYLNTRKPGVMEAGQKGHPEAESYRALAWTVKQLAAGKMPEDLEFYHSGKCGCCGRTLTVPESIRTGLGPVCAGKHK